MRSLINSRIKNKSRRMQIAARGGSKRHQCPARFKFWTLGPTGRPPTHRNPGARGVMGGRAGRAGGGPGRPQRKDSEIFSFRKRQ